MTSNGHDHPRREIGDRPFPAPVPTGHAQQADPETFEANTRELLSQPGLDRTLELVVAHAVAALPAVEGAGIALRDRDGSVRSHAPSDATAATLGRLEDELGEGPGHDCMRDRARVTIDDLATTGAARWPRFARAAAKHQVTGMCSLLLLTREGTAGALTLYSSTPGAFDPACLATTALIASHAAVAVNAARRVAGLSEALASRDMIGQAKGILIERFTLTDQQAFDHLVNASQSTNMKLRDVAAWLVTDTTERRAGPDRGRAVFEPAGGGRADASATPAPPRPTHP